MMITIIVPVYNGERYIQECLASLADQGLEAQDYEVLIVNDGSTDGTECLIDDFCRTNSAFRKLNKENGGVSSARNLGLEHAQGIFVSFVDADDQIAKGTYAPVLDYVRSNDLDAYYFGTTRNEEHLFHRVSAQTLQEETKICISKKPRGIHGSVYRKSILDDNGIRFDPSLSNMEDLLFQFYFIQHARRIGKTSLPFYGYRQNPASVTSQLHQVKGTYGDIRTKEYRLYRSSIAFAVKAHAYMQAFPKNKENVYLLSVTTGGILWTAMRSGYAARLVWKDIRENQISLRWIKFACTFRRGPKFWLKNWLRYSLKYAFVYKLATFLCDRYMRIQKR